LAEMEQGRGILGVVDGFSPSRDVVGIAMTKNFPRTGKKLRPKTAVRGKRYLCAKCHKRSPKPVKTPAPWYCLSCLKGMNALTL
jgi:hypothetical protein